MAFKTSALYCLAAVATLAGCASSSDVDDAPPACRTRYRLATTPGADRIQNQQRKLLEMVTQVEQLNAEVARLRGELDVQNHNLQTTQNARTTSTATSTCARASWKAAVKPPAKPAPPRRRSGGG